MNGDRRRNEGFTLVELLVVIAILGILAALVVPNLTRGTDKAHLLTCKSNLKGIHMAAYDYSLKTYAFPIAKGKDPPAHESLNVLLSSASAEGLEPDTFVCPAGEAQPAEKDENGKFVLDESTLSYTWVRRRTKSSTKAPLSSDKYIEGEAFVYSDGKHAGHKGIMNVLYTHGAIKDIDPLMDREKYEKNDWLPEGLTR